MAKKTETPPAEPEETLPAVVGAGDPPAHLMQDVEEYGGAGTSDRPEDSVLPYLYVVQKTSPQVNKRDPGYVEGAEPGDIYNTATGRLYKGDGPTGGLDVLHVVLERREVEWIPRSAGGGYVATHEVDTPLLQKITEVPKPQGKGVFRMLPSGHQLVTTAYHFVTEVETLDVSVVALTSTGLQVSRRWNTVMRSHKIRGPRGPVIAPSFSRVYRLRTVYQTNDQGDWFSVAVEDRGWVGEAQLPAYEVARAFYIQARDRGVPIGRPPAQEADRDAAIDADDDGPI